MPTDYSFTPETLQSMPIDDKTLYCPPSMGSNRGIEFEPWFTNWLRSALTEDMVFLDIGAGIGHYVVLAADRVKAVVAVEPNPGARAVLRENIRRNGFANVTVVEKPLFSKTVRGNIRGQRLRISPVGHLETTTLDALNLVPDVVKIDVEGAEYDVLVGGEQTLLRCAPTLLIEVHLRRLERYGRKRKHVYRFLQDAGYKITELEKQEDYRWIRAEKRQRNL